MNSSSHFPLKKMTIIFKTNQGETHSMIFNYGTTINQILTSYLEKIGRTELTNNNSNKIHFLFNTTEINFGSQTKIENFFQGLNAPKIFVSFNEQVYHSHNYNPLINQNIRTDDSIFVHKNLGNNNQLEQENKELKRQLRQERNKIQLLTQENYELKKQLKENKLKNTSIESGSGYVIGVLNPGDKIIAVNFVSMGNQDIGHYNLICKNNELFIKLEERLYKDFPKFKEFVTFFECKGKKIKRFKTMNENNIKNNDIINIFVVDE